MAEHYTKITVVDNKGRVIPDIYLDNWNSTCSGKTNKNGVYDFIAKYKMTYKFKVTRYGDTYYGEVEAGDSAIIRLE